MRRTCRIVLWSTSWLIAGCAVLVCVAVLVMPRPTPDERARDSKVPAPPSGPGHGWRYASDGTRLHERVYPARCRCPLLLVDGDADRIVDRAGHAVLFNAYAGADKTRLTVPGGGHGYETVRKSLPRIAAWVETRGR